MTTHRGFEKRRRVREERQRRAVEAVVAHARENGLCVEEPTVLNDLFSLMVHLKPAPVVARVATCMAKLRTPIEGWLEREIAVTTYLAEQGAPVVVPSQELPPGPHERDGFPISFWTYVEPDPDRTPTNDDCSAMLVDLHITLRAYPGELPMLCADDVPRGLEMSDRSANFLDESDADLLRASAERLRPIWEAPGDKVRSLHGDVHPGNLIAHAGAQVFLAGRTLSRSMRWPRRSPWRAELAETAQVDALDEVAVEDTPTPWPRRLEASTSPSTQS